MIYQTNTSQTKHRRFTSYLNLKVVLICVIAIIAAIIIFKLIGFKTPDKNTNPELAKIKQNLNNLQKEAENNPQDYIRNKDYAHALYITNNNQQAIKAYTNTIKLNSNDAVAYNNLATLYRKEKDYEKAADAYNSSIKVNPKQVNAYINLAQMYIYDLKDYQKGTDIFAKAIEANPTNLDIRIMLAKTYENHKNYEKALTTYNDILKINKDNKTAKAAIERLNKE